MNRIAITAISICSVLAAFVIGVQLRPGPTPVGASRSLPVRAPGQTNLRKTISISGTATLDVVPDVLDVAIELGVDRAPTSRAAARELERRRADLLKRITAAGIRRKQTALSQINIAPVWESDPTRIVGYSATLSVTATLRDFDRAPAILDAAAAAGARRIQTSFRSTEMPELKKRVRSMALRAARDKAAQIREALDLESIDVASVSESPTGQGWGYWYQSPWLANAVAVANPAQVLSGGFAPEIQPLTLTVSITYEIGG